MPVDPATDHAGRRLTNFLSRAISDLKPKEPGPMPAPIVPPANNLTTMPARKADDLVPSLTGAGSLADALTRRIQAAKARSEQATNKVAEAFAKSDQAAVFLERIAQQVEAEADAAMAQLGKISNLGS
jgi:hypothetical protein